MRIEHGNNAVRERQAAYAAIGAKQDHALVRELWAIEGQSDRSQVKRIVERSGLPVKWIGEYRPAQGLSSHIKTRFPESSLMKVNGSLIVEAGKLHYPREYRIEMFRVIADGIRRCDKNVQIALCKETPQVWKAVGLDGSGLCCNCTG
jgi:hypothetical protein